MKKSYGIWKFNHGAKGYILKIRAGEELLKAIRRYKVGPTYFSKDDWETIMKGADELPQIFGQIFAWYT